MGNSWSSSSASARETEVRSCAFQVLGVNGHQPLPSTRKESVSSKRDPAAGCSCAARLGNTRVCPPAFHFGRKEEPTGKIQLEEHCGVVDLGGGHLFWGCSLGLSDAFSNDETSSSGAVYLQKQFQRGWEKKLFLSIVLYIFFYKGPLLASRVPF